MSAVAHPVPPVASGVAAVEEGTESVAWRMVIVALVLIIWLIPVKVYTLPVTLPFQLEVYRLTILGMLFAWFLARLGGRARLTAGGLRGPVLLLGAAAIASVFTTVASAQQAGIATQSVKTLSYFLSFLIAFLLISSTVRTFRDIEAITAAIVIGGAIVSIAAIYEYRTGYNVFDHLEKWIPLLRHDHSKDVDIRNGRLRVYASSQHPIALGAGLIMSTPLALYLARRAESTLRKRLWQGSALLLAAGAAETQSRTVILMLCAMVPAGLWLRGRAVKRYWPLLIVMLGAIHLASPASISGLYKSFLPSNGLVGQQETRAGEQGSGRIADLKPGLKLWWGSPVVGHGLGTEPTAGATAQGGVPSPNQIIFDDQYMTSLVETGVLGLIAVLWFGVALLRKMARLAKETFDEQGDLLAAYTITCLAYYVGMLTYDAFSFVQVTLLFFLCAALGLRLRTLMLRRDPLPAAAASSPTQ